METNERVPERQLLCFSARVWIMYEMLPLQQMEGEGGDERPWRGLSRARGGCGCRCAMGGRGQSWPSGRAVALFAFTGSHHKNAFTLPLGQALQPPGKPDAWGWAKDRKVGFTPRILAVGSEP